MTLYMETHDAASGMNLCPLEVIQQEPESNPETIRMETSCPSVHKMIKIESPKNSGQESSSGSETVKISLSLKIALAATDVLSVSPIPQLGLETKVTTELNPTHPSSNTTAEAWNELQTKLLADLEQKDKIIQSLREGVSLLRNLNSSLKLDLESFEGKFQSHLNSQKVENNSILKERDALIERLKQECSLGQKSIDLQSKRLKHQTEELNRALESLERRANSNEKILETNHLTAENTNALTKQLRRQFETYIADSITRDFATLSLSEGVNPPSMGDKHSSDTKIIQDHGKTAMEIEYPAPQLDSEPIHSQSPQLSPASIINSYDKVHDGI